VSRKDDVLVYVSAAAVVEKIMPLALAIVTATIVNSACDTKSDTVA